MEANRTMYPGELSPGSGWHRSRLSDDFSLSPNSRTTMRSTGGFSFASNRTMGGRIQSAPLLHSTAAPSVASWYTKGAATGTTNRAWKALGSAYRDVDELRNATVEDASDRRDFIDGLVPNWSKDTVMRMKGMLEHLITWTYYHIQRDENHPQRKEVGEFLDPKNVPIALRSGAARFRFWRDLKPPFQVVQVTRSSDALGKWRDVDAEGHLRMRPGSPRGTGLGSQNGPVPRHAPELEAPAGVLSQRNDFMGRETVYDIFDSLIARGFLPGAPKRVGAVGRLDKETTGLIVMTDDRELNYAITSSPLEKRYEVTVLLAV
ncbi:unnamed protein product [Cladocopium goreaui]|uniref:Pseudouridine synthase RsuA/RluA-like domain-containing protein n=1 Tax=Cladocopium goreaui TaxID=2562237 RepID=A0A9P1C487_9DINO|nr:unnamed protein product [Cladocopium goreaui]